MPNITEAELLFIKNNYDTLGAKECAKQLNVAIDRVIYVANKKLNIVRSKGVYRPRHRPDRPANTYAVNHEELLRVDTPIKAYVLGLLWADGHIVSQDQPNTTRRNNGVTFSTTYPDADQFIPYLMEVGKWSVYKINPRPRAPKAAARVMCSGRPIAKAFIDLGFKDKHLGMDKILAIIPVNLRRYWYLGFTDGDGCFYINTSNSSYRFSFAGCVEQNWSAIEAQLIELGIKYHIERTKSISGAYSKIHISGKMRVGSWGHWLYEGHTIGLKRKKAKWEEVRNQCNQWATFETLS